jgi:hypothetical protein
VHQETVDELLRQMPAAGKFQQTEDARNEVQQIEWIGSAQAPSGDEAWSTRSV